MYQAYITALCEIMEADSHVCSLLSDSGTDFDVLMARDFPGQCFNFGIMEQHKVAAASGMAAMGWLPFVHTTGTFLAYRAFEFIRNDICFQRRNVKLIGSFMGMGWGTLGASHHSTEDIAALRALPGLTLLSASTPRQLAGMIHAAYAYDGPIYIRTGAGGEPEFYDDMYIYEIGVNSTLVDGRDYVVFTTGTILGEVMEAVSGLNAEGWNIGLVDVHTIKPLDEEGVRISAEGKKAIFTVEEHNTAGGLGGAVAEAVAGTCQETDIHRIGLKDCFAKGYGTIAQVRKANGLDASGIYQQIKKYLQEV